MKITNNQLINGLVPALNQLSQLRTGSKIAYCVAYTLKKIVPEYEAFEAVRKQLNERYEAEKEQVDKEFLELMSLPVEFEVRAINATDLDSCLDSDKVTAAMLLQLGDFIIE